MMDKENLVSNNIYKGGISEERKFSLVRKIIPNAQIDIAFGKTISILFCFSINVCERFRS